jgi:hypothetical protein
MTRFHQLLLAMILISPMARAIEIDRQEVPLLKLTCPLDSNPEANGPHETIVYVLYKSGIGYSAREAWNAFHGGHSGKTTNRYRFWLEPSMIEAVVAAAQSYPPAKEIPPRNQQLIIEGSAIPTQIVSSWLRSSEFPLKLFYLLDPRMREDLLSHFRRVQEVEAKQ